MMTCNLVSIIVPTYNDEKYISIAIESVLAQTYPNWELLIIDDASSDLTVDIIESIVPQSDRIRLFKMCENKGAGAARNIGIREAKGQYIAFLDADDWWYPTKLEEQIAFMQKNSYSFTFTAFEYTDSELNITGVSHKPTKISYYGILAGNNIGTPGVVIDVETVGKMFMPMMRMSEDWALWILFIKKVGGAYSINKPLWKYRTHSKVQICRKWKFLKSNFRVYREVVGMPGFLAVAMLIFVFVPKHILKKLFNMFDSWWYMRRV